MLDVGKQSSVFVKPYLIPDVVSSENVPRTFSNPFNTGIVVFLPQNPFLPQFHSTILQ